MHLVPLDDRPALAGGSLLALLALAILLGLVVRNLRTSTVAEASALRRATRLHTAAVTNLDAQTQFTRNHSALKGSVQLQSPDTTAS